MKKKLNFNEFAWFIILLGLTICIYTEIRNGFLLYFIHPRMKGLVYFLCIVLAVLTIFQVPKVFVDYKSRKEKIRIGYIIFIIPILFITAVNPSGLNPEISEKRGLVLVDNDVLANIDRNENLKGSSNKSNETVEMTDDNFYKIYQDLCKNPQNYNNKKIIISGFTYKDEDSMEEKFIVGRMLITCCAADASIIGLECKNESSTSTPLKMNKWVKVTGRISQTIYHAQNAAKDRNVPLIQVEKIDYISLPKNQYIYK